MAEDNHRRIERSGEGRKLDRGVNEEKRDGCLSRASMRDDFFSEHRFSSLCFRHSFIKNAYCFPSITLVSISEPSAEVRRLRTVMTDRYQGYPPNADLALSLSYETSTGEDILLSSPPMDQNRRHERRAERSDRGQWMMTRSGDVNVVSVHCEPRLMFRRLRCASVLLLAAC